MRDSYVDVLASTRLIQGQADQRLNTTRAVVDNLAKLPSAGSENYRPTRL